MDGLVDVIMNRLIDMVLDRGGDIGVELFAGNVERLGDGVTKVYEPVRGSEGVALAEDGSGGGGGGSESLGGGGRHGSRRDVALLCGELGPSLADVLSGGGEGLGISLDGCVGLLLALVGRLLLVLWLGDTSIAGRENLVEVRFEILKGGVASDKGATDEDLRPGVQVGECEKLGLVVGIC